MNKNKINTFMLDPICTPTIVLKDVISVSSSFMLNDLVDVSKTQ